MKKKVTNKLSLDKETISRLSDEQASLIGGGATEKTNTCQCKTEFNRGEDAAYLLAGGSCCEDSCRNNQQLA